MATTSHTTINIQERITELQSRIKELKISKQDATAQVNEMRVLKEQLGKDRAEGLAPGFQLKTPKGTVDHKPEATLLRNKIFRTLESIFVKYGGSTIDTPVFELKEILAGKYGEDSKLIYDLQDQGGELCSLRYDLTVPFARFLAMNAITAMKRYHIGKVYRRDQPVMSKGRMREFYQCDFDIAGSYDPMVPDAEILCLLCEALTALDIGEFTVKLNHRKILDGIFEFAGVPAEITRAISSSVDKLDKSPWSEVKREMTKDKGLTEEVADKIGEFVGLKGPAYDLLAKLEGDKRLSSVPSAKEGLADMRKLFEYLEVLGVLDKMSFDMSLARGLDYYTGIIYEAITEASAPPSISTNPPVPTSVPPSNTNKPNKTKLPATEDGVDESSVGVGSIAAGGRYDNLVGMFSEAAGGRKDAVPCVGVSIGVERVYSIMEMKRRGREEKARGKETEVYVMNFGREGLLKERMSLAKLFRDNGIKAEYMYKESPKDRAQFNVADSDQIPYVAILAPAELKAGTVRIKRQVGKDAAGDDRGEEVQMTRVVEYLKEKLANA
ncbi:MAG: Cytoplasmic and mitochondrial histidine tRNA synthetase [Tremellales sp. Tagirdzhanova-0007]|nr:MAG: Cytoplasmic and mitochondrial histidine tRNA synthetase [Tremellales sp. Tagirdzhanova-0007]